MVAVVLMVDNLVVLVSYVFEYLFIIPSNNAVALCTQ